MNLDRRVNSAMNSASKKFPIVLYSSVALGLCVSVFLGYEFFYHHPYWTYRAFRITSESMCPTVCKGERIFAQTQPETSYSPQRGDVMAIEIGPEHSIILKRVIGIADDIVAPGPDNTILINGQPWQAPAVCGKPVLPSESEVANETPSSFSQVAVPKGCFFVIGDNLPHSFDSRYEQFGLVSLDQVRGKVGLIYWSPGRSRIGCIIR
jgi:signal peptidase I